MDEMTLTLSSPITEEQFDAITDVDFDNTDRIWFHTKHGKDVVFVKRKNGKWVNIREGNRADCDQCGQSGRAWMNFCFLCGAEMEGQAE